MTLALLIGSLGFTVPQKALATFDAVPLPGNIPCPPGGVGFDTGLHTPGTISQTFNAIPLTSDLVVRLKITTDPAGGIPDVNAGLASLVDTNTGNPISVVPVAPDSLTTATRTFAAVFSGIDDGVYDIVFCIALAAADDPVTGDPLFPAAALGNKHSDVVRVVVDNQPPIVTCAPNPLVLNVLATDVPVPLNFNQALIDFLQNTPAADDAIEGIIAPVQNNAPAGGFLAGDTPVRFFASDSGNREGEAFCTVRVTVTPVAGCVGLGQPIGNNQFCLDLNAVVPFCGLTVFPSFLDLQTVGVGDITPNFIYTIFNSGNAHGRYVATFSGFSDPLTGNLVINANNLRYINSAVDTAFLSMIQYSDVDKKVVYPNLAPQTNGPVGNKLEVLPNFSTSGAFAGSVAVTNDQCGEALHRLNPTNPGDIVP